MTVLIISVVWLIMLVATGSAIDAPLHVALNVSNGIERPLLLVLEFLLRSPIGLVITWITGIVAVFRFAPQGQS